MQKWRKTLAKAALRAVAAIGIIFLFLEGTSRLYLVVDHGFPAIRPRNLIFDYYPEMRNALNAKMARDDEPFDVLILAASVFEPKFGNIPELLQTRLAETLDRPVRLHNVARGAHSSLDSLYKYRLLADKSYDLVIVYHGINEVRANNCPPDRFREDYAHLQWYDELNVLFAHPHIDYSVLPYVAHRIQKRFQALRDPAQYVPQETPGPEWTQYGGDIRTAAPFKRNVEAILEIARSKGEPVLLMTYAYYVPDNYSREAFNEKNLDYQNHTYPIELWGEPAHVVAGIRAHNQALTEIETTLPLLDQQNLIPSQGINFNDICHLSPPGCERFVQGIIDVIENSARIITK